VLKTLVIASMIVLVSTAWTLGDPPATRPFRKPPMIIILKLDDLAHWISPRWTRVNDFLTERRIRASYGIIGEELAKANADTIKWIKAVHEAGQIEIWCHGYHARTAEEKIGEFEVGTADEQAAALKKCQDIARDKLGFELAAFGPHWSGTTDETDKALEATPQIKIWLYGPAKPKYFTRLSIPRIMALENPTFVPDFEKFKKIYDDQGSKQSVLVLQGHPDMWQAPGRWEGFVQIIDFLQAKGCTFMTPTEYAATLPATSSKP